jgi:hypothetical protein
MVSCTTASRRGGDWACANRNERVGSHRCSVRVDLKRFFQVIEAYGNVQHEIMLKLLFYTARPSE